MNFPMEFPLFRLIYWVLNTAGVGGITAVTLGGASALSALLTLRWIKNGAEANERETYAYPTATLLEHGEPRSQ